MSIRLINPCPAGRYTDAFGWRAAIPGVVGAQLHTGRDIAASTGTPIYAAHAGRVNRIWWDTFVGGAPAGGNMLQIGSALVTTRYAHMNGYAVGIGREVRAGDLIGWVGSTGAATGAHLHFETLIGGMFVNPDPYIAAALPPTKPPQKTTEEDDMSKNAGFQYKTADGKTMNVVANSESGFDHRYEAGDGGYNSRIARAFGTGNFEQITESHARALGEDLAKVRPR